MHIEMVPQLIIMKFELEGIVISEIHIIGQSLTKKLGCSIRLQPIIGR